MSRLIAPLAVLALSLLVVGCCCDPCGGRYAGAHPAGITIVAEGHEIEGVMKIGGVTLVPMETETHVIEVKPDAQGNVIVIGPDGKPIQVKIVDGKGGTLKVVEIEKGAKERAAKPATQPTPPVPPAPPAAAERGYFGFTPVPVALVPAEERGMMGIKATEGVVVVNVLPGSPAAKAGLKDLDVLLSFAGHPVTVPAGLEPGNPESAAAFFEAFGKIASGVKPGATVDLVVLRGNDKLTLRATAISLDDLKKLAPMEDEEGEEDEGPEAK